MTNSRPPKQWSVLMSQCMVALMDWIAPLFGRPRVQSMDTKTLVSQLNEPEPSVVLVDVRSDAEVDVSMIPGAITRDQFWQQRDQLTGKTVVAYCTVGGRSLLFAQSCARLGFDVRNYQGSILEWCEEGQALVAPDGSPTRRLHTHNRLFRAPAGYERAASREAMSCNSLGRESQDIEQHASGTENQ